MTRAAGILVVVLLAFPGSAAASTKSKSATATGNGAIASASAKCPSGQRATGGGFKAPPTLTSPFFVVYESRKVGQRTWRASGQILELAASGQAFTLTALVYCSDSAPSTKSKSASVTSGGADPHFTADARCGSGNSLAGGFLGPPPSNGGGGANYLVLDSHRADKKTWRSRMRSPSAPGTTFTSYVYCADEKKPAARSGSATSPSAGTLVTALSGECKRGTKPVSGGFSQPNAGFGSFFQLFYESFKSGKRWRISASSNAAPGSPLNSIAYCA